MGESIKTLAFVGGGNMAAALVAGLSGKAFAGEQMHVVDINPQALAQLAQRYGVSTAAQIDARVAEAAVLVLAVKPQQMQAVARQLAGFILPEQLVISIAAGIRGADLARWLGRTAGAAGIVRCMPNTPALIGQGMTGMVALPGVSPEQRHLAQTILQAVGKVLWLEREDLLDAVTALSGSGPAYVFYFMEAMQQAGQALGLRAEDALQLVQQTFAGATQLTAQSAEPVALLRERVTSKGGTTHAALAAMTQAHIGPAIVAAVKAAAARGQAMGEEFGQDEG
jgi:pyrroline-5-carboxylate reductase